MIKKQQYNIGIFIDYHNIQISLKQFFNLPYPDLSLVKNYAERLGKIVTLIVYADWNLFNNHRRYFKTIDGVTLIHEPHYKKRNGIKKETLDMRMAFDIGTCLERTPEIDMYILATGDADFLPVVTELKIRGKKVVIIAEQNSLNNQLKKSATSIITYQELVENFFKKKTRDSKISILIPSIKEEGVIFYEK